MLNIVGQRIKDNDIESSTALYKLTEAFKAASRADRAYGDSEVIQSYCEMIKKFHKEYSAWDALDLPRSHQVTATNMGAESVFSIFKMRESQDTSICIANLWRTTIAKASRTRDWFQNVDSERKKRILSEAIVSRAAVEQSDRTCNQEMIVEYLPPPTETGKNILKHSKNI